MYMFRASQSIIREHYKLYKAIVWYTGVLCVEQPNTLQGAVCIG